MVGVIAHGSVGSTGSTNAKLSPPTQSRTDLRSDLGQGGVQRDEVEVGSGPRYWGRQPVASRTAGSVASAGGVMTDPAGKVELAFATGSTA